MDIWLDTWTWLAKCRTNNSCHHFIFILYVWFKNCILIKRRRVRKTRTQTQRETRAKCQNLKELLSKDGSSDENVSCQLSLRKVHENNYLIYHKAEKIKVQKAELTFCWKGFSSQTWYRSETDDWENSLWKAEDYNSSPADGQIFSPPSRYVGRMCPLIRLIQSNYLVHFFFFIIQVAVEECLVVSSHNW